MCKALTSNFPLTFYVGKTCRSAAFRFVFVSFFYVFCNNQHFYRSANHSFGSVQFLVFALNRRLSLSHDLTTLFIKIYFQQSHSSIETTFPADMALLTSTLYHHQNELLEHVREKSKRSKCKWDGRGRLKPTANFQTCSLSIDNNVVEQSFPLFFFSLVFFSREKIAFQTFDIELNKDFHCSNDTKTLQTFQRFFTFRHEMHEKSIILTLRKEKQCYSYRSMLWRK